MLALILFLLLIIGLNTIPVFFKFHVPKLERTVKAISLGVGMLFVLLNLLAYNGLHLTADPSNMVISVLFLITTVLYFTAVRYSLAKFLFIIVSSFLVVIGIANLHIGKEVYHTKANSDFAISIFDAGIFSCGDRFVLTENHLLIFDREIFRQDGLCIQGIHRVETISLEGKSAVFHIYHDMIMDSENPYVYEVENIFDEKEKGLFE